MTGDKRKLTENNNQEVESIVSNKRPSLDR